MKSRIGRVVQEHPQYAKLANDLLMAGGLVANAGKTIAVELKESSKGHKRRTPSDFRLVYNPEKFEQLPEPLKDEFVIHSFDHIIQMSDDLDRLVWRVVEAPLDGLEQALNDLDNQGYDVNPDNIRPIHKDAAVVWSIIAKAK